MKFLYVGDLHQDELIPVNRIDDFIDTRKEKINEILQIAKTNNVKAVLHGGDFFNRPKMSNEFVTSIIETWNNQLIPIDIQDLTFKLQAGTISEQEYLDEIQKYKTNNIPFISIIGNHDLIGESIESYSRTSLNVLETSGFLHIVDKANPIVFKEGSISVAITGHHYDKMIDKNNDKSGYIVSEKVQVDGKDCTYQIHMTHNMLTSTSYGKKFAHTTIYEIQNETLADLTINGHDHIGFDTIEYNGKLFANPGSPFRLSIDKKEIARMPKVMLITIDNTGLSVEDIYLTCAKPGDQVLSENAKIVAQNKQSTMAKIQSMINQSSLKKGLRIVDIIDNIGSATNIDKEILNDVQNKIMDSMNQLQTPFSPSGDYYITRLELENFLSHKNSVFNFEKGLNILSGESRSGKSAVLRALREVMTCYITQPRDAIFFGATYFKVTIYTSNGYIITRKVEKDEKKGFNGYEIYDPNTGISTEYNTKAVSIVQEILGYNKIKLTDKKSIDVNSVIQGDGWFYIGNNITAPDRARLLGVVYGTHYADAANKDIATNIKKTTTLINESKKDKERLDEQKKEYDYLTPLGNDIKQAEILMKEVEEKEVTLSKIKELYAMLLSLELEINTLKQVQTTLNIQLKPQLMELKEKQTNLNTIKEKVTLIDSITQQGKQFRVISNLLKNIHTFKQTSIELKQKQEVLFEDKKKYEQCVNLQNIQQNILNEQQKLTIVQTSLTNLQEMKILSNKMKQEKDTLIKFKENVSKVMLLDNQLKDIQKSMDELKLISKQFENLPKIKEIKELKKQEETLNKSKELIEQLVQLEKEKIEQERLLQDTKNENIKYINSYKEELQHLGTCPICHSNIDANLVNHLVAQHMIKVETK